MFEKEAEEYRNYNTNYYEWDSFCADDGEAVEEAYQKGAIDGYNKANEWHYVKDGDLPKDDNDVLVLLKDETMQVDYYFSKIGWNLSCKADVIAWKEIVLPELKETKEK